MENVNLSDIKRYDFEILSGDGDIAFFSITRKLKIIDILYINEYDQYVPIFRILSPDNFDGMRVVLQPRGDGLLSGLLEFGSAMAVVHAYDQEDSEDYEFPSPGDGIGYALITATLRTNDVPQTQ